MNLVLILVILAGLLAVLYGVVQTASLMRAPAGSAKMQEIAAAIQEGAQAYLRRQYTTIAGVGIVILIAILALIGWREALGFFIGAVLSGLAGLGPRQCAHRPGRLREPRRGPLRGVPLWSGDRHAGGGFRPHRRRRLLCDSHPGHGAAQHQP
jgi:hypothetical protein